MAQHPKRRRYFIDPKVQGAILLRATRYWFLSIAVVGALTVLGWMFVSPGFGVLMQIRQLLPSLLGTLLIALLASLLVLPIILLDLTRMTNRFAGPMFRLTRSMKAAANGMSVEPIHFRNGDYWQECADAFNTLSERLETASDTGELALSETEEHSELVEDRH